MDIHHSTHWKQHGNGPLSTIEWNKSHDSMIISRRKCQILHRKAEHYLLLIHFSWWAPKEHRITPIWCLYCSDSKRISPFFYCAYRGEFDLYHSYKAWEELIMIADHCNQSLLDSDKRNKMNPDKVGAELTVQGGILQPTLNAKCHNCGKTGHYPWKCWSHKKKETSQMPSSIDKTP